MPTESPDGNTASSMDGRTEFSKALWDVMIGFGDV